MNSRGSKNLIYSKGKSSGVMPKLKNGYLVDSPRIKEGYSGQPNITDTTQGDFVKRKGSFA